MSEDRVPISQVLPGMAIQPLDPGDRATWALVLIKVDAGPENEGWSLRTTASPNDEEMLGVLEIQVALLKKKLLDQWS